MATTTDLLLEPASIRSTMIGISSSTPLYLTIALLGVWWGHRVRLVRYLRYLLKLVPAELRTGIVHRTYEDVRTRVAARSTEESVGYLGAAHE